MSRASNVSEVLQVQRELVRITEQLELHKGRRQGLRGRARVASITVELRERIPAPEPDDPEPEPEPADPFIRWELGRKLKRAVRGMLQAGADGITAVLVGLVYALPVIACVAVVAYVGFPCAARLCLPCFRSMGTRLAALGGGGIGGDGDRRWRRAASSSPPPPVAMAVSAGGPTIRARPDVHADEDTGK